MKRARNTVREGQGPGPAGKVEKDLNLWQVHPGLLSPDRWFSQAKSSKPTETTHPGQVQQQGPEPGRRPASRGAEFRGRGTVRSDAHSHGASQSRSHQGEPSPGTVVGPGRPVPSQHATAAPREQPESPAVSAGAPSLRRGPCGPDSRSPGLSRSPGASPER